MIYILCALAGAVGLLALVTLIDVIVMGAAWPSRRRGEIRPTALVTTDNRIDRQKGNSCGGYSSAYLLRHYGVDADGEAVYAEMGRKSRYGNLPPISVVKVLRRYGVDAVYRRGDVDALKRCVSGGDPAILLIRSKVGGRGLHFVCAVGYDDEGFFIADSAREWDGHSAYNRKIPYDEFGKLWNVRKWNRPLYSRTYIAKR